MPPVIVSKGLSLREETPADRELAVALFSASRREGFAGAGWPEAMVRALLDDQFRLQSLHFVNAFPALVRMVAELAGVPMGRFYVDYSAARWHVVEIEITPEQQGKGIGTMLLEWLAREATQAGIPALELQVARENSRAAALYLRLGFVAVGGISATHQTLRRALS